MPKRVTTDKKERIAEDYRQGFSKADICKRNRCSSRTLAGVCRQYGLRRRFSLASFPVEMHLRILEDYQEGLLVRDIMKKHGISQGMFYYILEMNDVSRRNWHINKKGKKCRFRSRTVKLNARAVLTAYKKGLALKDIYLSWGATRADVTRILRRAGLTPNRCLQKAKREDLYRTLFKKQKGRCAICGVRTTSIRFALDHDHSTGKVRGLLCAQCNTGLGSFRDSTMLLIAAKTYLEKGDDR